MLAVLSRCACEGMTVRLPPEQLDRKLYVAVDEVLRACGEGSGTARRRCTSSRLTPKRSSPTQTEHGHDRPRRRPRVVPDASRRGGGTHGTGRGARGHDGAGTVRGEGAIAPALREAGAVVGCVEIDPRRAETLRSLGFAVTEGDALAFETACVLIAWR